MWTVQIRRLLKHHLHSPFTFRSIQCVLDSSLTVRKPISSPYKSTGKINTGNFCRILTMVWLGHLLPPVSGLLQGFMCVCTQVSGSVVSNWALCEFCGRVYCDIWYIFLIPQFLRHQTMDTVQKHNSSKSQWLKEFRDWYHLFILTAYKQEIPSAYFPGILL
jgi:hypothetical protein